MNKQGVYIYGFVPDDCFAGIANKLSQIGIYSIAYGDISAIVSDTKHEKLEYLDREALAHLLVDHQQKIERIVSEGCSIIIPMQLGTIVSSGNDVIKILKNGSIILKDTFKIIDNVSEFDLVAVWSNFSDVIKNISDTSQVRQMKEDIVKKNIYDEADAVNIGKIIKTKIEEKNIKVSHDVVNSLIPFCIDTKKHETMNDEMLLNSAFLVKKENKDLFMEMVDQLDLKYEDNISFKIVGPLPCYSFYTIECKVLDKRDIETAKEILGIDFFKSESDLKKAYRQKAALIHPDKHTENQKVNTDGFIQINNAYKILLEYLRIIKHSSDIMADEPFYLVKIK